MQLPTSFYKDMGMSIMSTHLHSSYIGTYQLTEYTEFQPRHGSNTVKIHNSKHTAGIVAISVIFEVIIDTHLEGTVCTLVITFSKNLMP